MPISGLCRPERACVSNRRSGTVFCLWRAICSLGIVLLASEALEEGEQWVVWFE